MSSERAPDPDLLLRHWSFVRALARRIATDESSADDLAQETWLAAQEGALTRVHSTRGWLAGMVSNLGRERARGETRRREREMQVARAESLPAEAETIEAAEIGRELVGLVLELEEPFRAVVLLRYFHDLPPRVIAQRLGVPVRTVNSRLSRGLARIREAWNRRHPDERDGARGALALLAAPGTTVDAARTLSIGVGVMSTKTILAAAIALGAVALLLVWRERASETGNGAIAATSTTESTSGVETPGAGAAATESERVPATFAAHEAVALPAPAPAVSEQRAIRGRVLDAEATPLSGVQIVFRRGADEPVEGRATSNASGVFELDAPRSDGLVTIDDPHLVALCYGRVLANTALEPLIVAAPFRDLGGRTIDESGAALPGVVVRLAPPPSFRTRFDALFDVSEVQTWSAQADEQGRFELARAPVLSQAQLIASLDGYADASVEAPAGERRDLAIVLARAAIEGASISGRVEDQAGSPVPWARVGVGGRVTMSDARGNFHLALDDPEHAFELVALSRGALPGRVRATLDPASGAPLWPNFVIVKLGPPPLSIAGRVTDPAGRPIADVRIWIDDPTEFGELREDVKAKVEFVLAASGLPDSDAELSQAGWCPTRTDEDGRFRVEGLLPRTYSLRLMHPTNLGVMDAGRIEAGKQDVLLVFDSGELHRVAGRIATRGGKPLENVNVRLLSYAYGGVSVGDQAVNTDAEGRFDFEGVGTGQYSLWIRGDELVPIMEYLDLSRSSALEITASVRCHVKVDWSTAPEAADTLRVLGASGEFLQLHEIGPSGETISATLPLVEGRSKSFSVASEAATLVLSQSGVEVKRVPLNLLPKTLNLVRP